MFKKEKEYQKPIIVYLGKGLGTLAIWAAFAYVSVYKKDLSSIHTLWLAFWCVIGTGAIW